MPDRIGASLLLLAGGLGSRMWGKNKLYLELSGAPLLGHILARLAPLFDETLLLAAQGGARAAWTAARQMGRPRNGGPRRGARPP